jgi:hypothetical protein
MVRKSKSDAMETQPVDRPGEVATPMGRAPLKRRHGTPALPIPRTQAETTRRRALKKQRSLLDD